MAGKYLYAGASHSTAGSIFFPGQRGTLSQDLRLFVCDCCKSFSRSFWGMYANVIDLQIESVCSRVVCVLCVCSCVLCVCSCVRSCIMRVCVLCVCSCVLFACSCVRSCIMWDGDRHVLENVGVMLSSRKLFLTYLISQTPVLSRNIEGCLHSILVWCNGCRPGSLSVQARCRWEDPSQQRDCHLLG